MARKSHDELLSDLQKKQAALQNRIASVEARKRKEEDRILTRKKILIGAYMLEKCKEAQEDFKKLLQELDKFLIRPHDRKLFNLPVKSDG